MNAGTRLRIIYPQTSKCTQWRLKLHPRIYFDQRGNSLLYLKFLPCHLLLLHPTPKIHLAYATVEHRSIIQSPTKLCQHSCKYEFTGNGINQGQFCTPKNVLILASQKQQHVPILKLIYPAIYSEFSNYLSISRSMFT